MAGQALAVGEYDVVLVGSHERAASVRKAVSSSPGGERALFGTTVTTFSSWVSSLWELYGDGRVLVGAAERSLTMDVVCASHAGTLAGAGLASSAVRCARAGAGLPAFQEACERAVRGEFDAGCNEGERALLIACGHYFQTIAAVGRVEEGEALARLSGALPSHPVRVLLYGIGALTAQQQRFLDANVGLCVSSLPESGAEGIQPAPEAVSLRFAFPSGPTAWPALLWHIVQDLREADGCQQVAVSCKDPLALYGRMAQPLVEAGLCAAVRARRAFPLTDFGRAFFSLRRFLTSSDAEWCVSDLTDFLLSPLSGASVGFAYDVDARARADRLTDRQELLASMRTALPQFELWEELVTDPEADIVAGTVEDQVRRSVGRSEAWRHEQLAAITALRSVTRAARLVGASMDACARVLQTTSVDASRVAGGASSRSSSQDEPPVDVLFCTNASAAHGAFSCDALVVADLTSACYPVSDADDAVSLLLERMGAAPQEPALQVARREFNELVSLPQRMLVLERPLNDEAAEPTYPAAVLEEFVDCYREDPAATDDIDNVYSLPPQLLEHPRPWENGEEHLVGNALLSTAGQPIAARIPQPVLGAVSDQARSLVVLPRSLGGGRHEREVLSPSQIESYVECPYKWFAQRRLRLSSLDEEFGPMAMGSFAHAALKSFYQHFQEETGELKVTVESLPRAKQIMSDVIARHRKEQPAMKPGSGRLVPTSQLERREVDELAAKLMDYLSYEAELLPTFHPVYFEHTIEAGSPVPYAGHAVIGSVDRVDVDDQGRAVIIDYKGSLGGGYAYADGASCASGLGKVQALVYAQALRRTLGLNVVGTLYVCYGKNPRSKGTFDGRVLESAHVPHVEYEKCAWMPRDDEPFSAYLDEVEEQVAQVLDGLFAGNVAPCPSADYVCTWCPVVSCPERRG